MAPAGGVGLVTGGAGTARLGFGEDLPSLGQLSPTQACRPRRNVDRMTWIQTVRRMVYGGDASKRNSNGLQPNSEGLHPSSDGLLPSSFVGMDIF